MYPDLSSWCSPKSIPPSLTNGNSTLQLFRLKTEPSLTRLSHIIANFTATYNQNSIASHLFPCLRAQAPSSLTGSLQQPQTGSLSFCPCKCSHPHPRVFQSQQLQQQEHITSLLETQQFLFISPKANNQLPLLT